MRLNGIFDGGDDDRIFYDGDDHAASGQIGDDFLGRRSSDFLSLKRAWARRDGHEKGECKSEQENSRDARRRIGRRGVMISAHIATVPQVTGGTPRAWHASYHLRGGF